MVTQVETNPRSNCSHSFDVECLGPDSHGTKSGAATALATFLVPCGVVVWAPAN